jgi:hypothetical protein
LPSLPIMKFGMIDKCCATPSSHQAETKSSPRLVMIWLYSFPAIAWLIRLMLLFRILLQG